MAVIAQRQEFKELGLVSTTILWLSFEWIVQILSGSSFIFRWLRFGRTLKFVDIDEDFLIFIGLRLIQLDVGVGVCLLTLAITGSAAILDVE